MKTIGIIAEFNPFHNGHAYLINQAKRMTGADHAIIVMSGNYVQRGAPAFMDKFSRTEFALNNGADLVIELPVVYSMSSAAYFATGAISILNKLGVVDNICFGCEYDDIEILNVIADIIINEDEIYSESLQTHLRNGMSFVKSREAAIIKSLSMTNYSIAPEIVSDMLSKPNSILAIEYLKALKLSNSNMQPLAIKRTDHGYLSLSMEGGFASSSAIRNMYSKKSVYNFNNLRESLSLITPYNGMEKLENDFRKTYPITRNDFTSLIGRALINDKFGLTDLNNLFDSTPDLINRIRNMYSDFKDTETFITQCNSPSYTSGRIARVLFYSIINYTKDDFFNFKNDDYVYYFRILGFNKNHSELLTEIKNNSEIPMITKLSKAYEFLDNENALRMLNINRLADEVYRVIIQAKYGTDIKTEEENGVIIK